MRSGWGVVFACMLMAVATAAKAQYLLDQKGGKVVPVELAEVTELPVAPPAPPPEYYEQKKAQCVKVFVSRKFCDCYERNVPPIWRLEQYVAILAHDKDWHRYADFQDWVKADYDAVETTHRKCAAFLR